MALRFSKLPDSPKPLGLYLPDSLGANAEFFSDLPKGVKLTVHHAGTHPQNVCRAIIEAAKLALAERIKRDGR